MSDRAELLYLRERVKDQQERIAQLRDALIRIGRLTRRVGWMESGGILNSGPSTGAEDMREIQKIASEATGLEFSEYT